MAATKAPKERTPRRHLPPAEKRRIVELTLGEGASALAIAREHGVHPNSLHQWKTLYYCCVSNYCVIDHEEFEGFNYH